MAVLDVKGICKTFDKNTVVLRGKKRARFAESGCISGWCSRTSTFSRNIRRCKT